MIGAILGIGGGVFLVPVLILAFGVPMTQAAGAGLVAVTATSCAAVSVNLTKGMVNLRLGLVLEAATVLGAITGGIAAGCIPSRVLVGAFGILLLVIFFLLWGDKGQRTLANDESPGELGGEYDDAASGKRVVYAAKHLPIGLTTGFAAGNLSGLLGIGGGVLKVPILHMYCGMPMKAAAATSNFMLGITAAVSGLVYLQRGDIDPMLSGSVALGALLGSRTGARISGRIRDRNLRKAFSLLTLLLGIQMLRRSLGG